MEKTNRHPSTSLRPYENCCTIVGVSCRHVAGGGGDGGAFD